MNLLYASTILLTIAAVAVLARIAIKNRSKRIEEEEYQKFIESCVPDCHCEYDCPCDGVLAGGLCDEKRELDYEEMDEYRDHEDEEY